MIIYLQWGLKEVGKPGKSLAPEGGPAGIHVPDRKHSFLLNMSCQHLPVNLTCFCLEGDPTAYYRFVFPSALPIASLYCTL